MKISIIGSGNVAHFFSRFFIEKGILVSEILSRNTITGKELASICHATFIQNESELDTTVDAILLAVPDDVLDHYNFTTAATVIHCSGSLDSFILKKYSNHVGNIWPIFSISNATSLHAQNIPLVLQHSTEQAQSHVKILANCISNQTQEMTLQQKQASHIAATISNNFSNHLYSIAYEICQQHQLPFSMLLPMLQQSVAQLQVATPLQNQTGPAIRKDENTIETHRQFLKQNTAWLELYNTFTTLIQQQSFFASEPQ